MLAASQTDLRLSRGSVGVSFALSICDIEDDSNLRVGGEFLTIDLKQRARFEYL
jgi:hypothetical protein